MIVEGQKRLTFNYFYKMNSTDKIEKSIKEIAQIVFESAMDDTYGLLQGSGGSILFLAANYSLTGDEKFLEKSIELLEKNISSTTEILFPNDFSIAFPAVSACWIIDQFIRKDILDETELVNSRIVVNHLIDSISLDDLNLNRHDLFYGYLGKALIILENDIELSKVNIDPFISAIKRNAKMDTIGLYWNTPYPFYKSHQYENTINLGIPHGSLGIVLFLLKICSVYGRDSELETIIANHIKWLIEMLKKNKNELKHFYSIIPIGSGKLGWCYGDLAIAYTLLRYYEEFGDHESKAVAYELIEKSSFKSMEQAGVIYYQQYGYHDMCICHGTTSIAYMYKKMFLITKDQQLIEMANKWLNSTIENLNIYLPQIKSIAEKEKNNPLIDTSLGFLNGLSGIGLALISFVDPKLSDWDKLLLLDRPGRE